MNKKWLMNSLAGVLYLSIMLPYLFVFGVRHDCDARPYLCRTIYCNEEIGVCVEMALVYLMRFIGVLWSVTLFYASSLTEKRRIPLTLWVLIATLCMVIIFAALVHPAYRMLGYWTIPSILCLMAFDKVCAKKRAEEGPTRCHY